MRDPSDELLRTLRDFYDNYYPVPSPFELPEGQSNAVNAMAINFCVC